MIGHYRKQHICRVHSFEHSTNSIFTECLWVKTQQNKYTQQKTYLPSAGNKTLGKQQQDNRQRIDTRQKAATCAGRQLGCRPLELCLVSVSDTRQSLTSVFIWHSANRFVCRVFYFDTRQIKKFFSFLDLETFSTLHIQHVILHVKIWYISGSVCYI